jgi:hypothetical protein
MMRQFCQIKACIAYNMTCLAVYVNGWSGALSANVGVLRHE